MDPLAALRIHLELNQMKERYQPMIQRTLEEEDLPYQFYRKMRRIEWEFEHNLQRMRIAVEIMAKQ